jgi:hypothetical protein
VGRMGLVAPVLAVLMALGPMAVSADVVPGPPRYRTVIESDGLSGLVKVVMSGPGTGDLKWSLEGLRPGHRLVIKVKSAPCSHRGALIVRHWQPVAGSRSSGEVALPAGSADAFIRYDTLRRGVVATVRSGRASDCARFSGYGPGGCAMACAVAAPTGAGAPRRRS